MSTGPKSNQPKSSQSKPGGKKPAAPPAVEAKPAPQKSPGRVGAGLFIVVIALIGIGAMAAGVKLPSKGNPEYVNWIGAFVALLIGAANVLIGLGYEISSKKY